MPIRGLRAWLAACWSLAEQVRPRVPVERVDNRGRVHAYTEMVALEQYRALAIRARQDPEAEVAFEESHLWLDDDPADVKAILSEHPRDSPGLGRP